MTGRWWAPAAAAVAVLVVVGAAVASRGGEAPVTPTRSADAPAGAARTTPPGSGDQLVRDGDRVAVSGRVLALPGRPVRMCAPVAVALPGYPAGQEPLPEYCELGVTVRGLDLAAIVDRRSDRGVVTGRAGVEGTYRAGIVAVTRQTAPGPEEDVVRRHPDTPPCPAPAGGWAYGEVDVEPVAAWLRGHQDRYVDAWVARPGGPPLPGATPQPGTTVVMVGTVQDPAAAEREVRSVWAGNLCVVRVPRPGATLTRVAAGLAADEAAWTAHGVYQTSPDMIAGTVDVRLVLLDPAAQRWLAQRDDRTRTIVPHPWVRPLR